MSDELLADIKNYLDITWSDLDTDKKIRGIGERGTKYLDKVVGVELEYEVEDKPRELLFEYCRYVRSGALSEFQNNYLSEILSLQDEYAIKAYKEGLDGNTNI